MGYTGKVGNSITVLILGTSLTVWVLLLAGTGDGLSIHHCPVTAAGPSGASMQMLLAMNPVLPLLSGWILMVVAMMLPTLIQPIRYICARSFVRRRLASAAVFAGAYFGVWMIAGLAMIPAVLGLNLLFPGSYLPAVGTGIAALAWQFSPAKQLFLNRGHDHKALAVFGAAASRDAFLFGAAHGCWCVGSGWALMLFPMLLPAGHNLAMVVVALMMVSEHLEHPRAPRWRIQFRGRLARALIAQARIKMSR